MTTSGRSRKGDRQPAEPREVRRGSGDASTTPRFTKWTAIYGVAGTATAALGFLLLAREQINLAPVLLLIAFLVLFPLALIK